MGKQYLVQCLPQRGFNERRRSGILFTAEGVLLQPEQLTEDILRDPGLRVLEIPAGARIVKAGEVVLSSETRSGQQHGPAAQGEPGATELNAEESGICAYLKPDGERCKAKVKLPAVFCGAHREKGEAQHAEEVERAAAEAADLAGATVTRLP